MMISSASFSSYVFFFFYIALSGNAIEKSLLNENKKKEENWESFSGGDYRWYQDG